MPARRPLVVRDRVHDELVDALAQLRAELELPDAFPAEVEAEARRAARDVPVDPREAGLDDLREVEFVTIDPAGATDLDQALHLERTAAGGVLHYAIADLPAFVEPGGAIDAEACQRGQTLYAADGRIPLHPVAISEGAASLLPDQDRRAFVWRFVLDEGARPTQTTLRRAVVRSRAQWSYADAQAAIDAGTAPPTLAALAWFGAQRLEREAERGGASLNVPETRIVADDGGYRLERDAPLAIEDANAQVSLLTGMAAAELMLRGGVGVLRTMPAADPEDVAAFRAQTAALGIPWRSGIRYGDYLRSLDRTSPAALAILDAAAGLFRGAGYVAFDGTPPADPVQAAIGAPYAHTTAPLRRLVDRWSLVICEAIANGREVPGVGARQPARAAQDHGAQRGRGEPARRRDRRPGRSCSHGRPRATRVRRGGARAARRRRARAARRAADHGEGRGAGLARRSDCAAATAIGGCRDGQRRAGADDLAW